MTFVSRKGWFVATKQLDIAQKLPFFFFSVISSSFCSVFAQKLQNTIKRRIRPFFSNKSVNLALKVYKTHGKHTANLFVTRNGILNQQNLYLIPPTTIALLLQYSDSRIVHRDGFSSRK